MRIQVKIKWADNIRFRSSVDDTGIRYSQPYVPIPPNPKPISHVPQSKPARLVLLAVTRRMLALLAEWGYLVEYPMRGLPSRYEVRR